MWNIGTPKKEEKSMTLYCFTPGVTLATFVIESIFAIVAWFRYGKSRFGKISAALLFFLGLFQLGEYLICRGLPQEPWIRLGFFATAMLPPLGLDLVGMATGRTRFVKTSYVLGGIFGAAILFAPGLFGSAACPGNCVVFDMYSRFGVWYAAYYALVLFAAIYELVAALRGKQEPRALTLWLLIAYAAFIVPTIAIELFVYIEDKAFPSVFCGFAIFLAIVLFARVLPLSVEKRGKGGKK